MTQLRLIGTALALSMAALLAGCAASGPTMADGVARDCAGSVAICSR
jgi:hypothetical protein